MWMKLADDDSDLLVGSIFHPVKLEPTRSSETSEASLIHTPCKNPRAKKYYSNHSKSPIC